MPLPPALPCPPEPPALVADLGARLSPAGGCAALVVETAPSNSRFSWGGARVEGAVPPHFTLSLWWRRLSDRPAALEVVFPGGSLLVNDGQVGWWENDARWAEHGWIPLPVTTAHLQHVQLEQDGAQVRAWIDGIALAPHTLGSKPEPGRVSIGLKGGPGDRARLWVDRVRLDLDP
jgi:hypothetical protein